MNYSFHTSHKTYFINAYYDFKNLHKQIKPYIGVGIGWSQNTLSKKNATSNSGVSGYWNKKVCNSKTLYVKQKDAKHIFEVLAMKKDGGTGVWKNFATYTTIDGCNNDVKGIDSTFVCALGDKLTKLADLSPLLKAIGTKIKEAITGKTGDAKSLFIKEVTLYCKDTSHKAEDICVLHKAGYVEEVIDLTITEGYI